MSYLDLAKAVLGTSPATKATYATKGVLEEVWRVGGWLVIVGSSVRAVRVPRELKAWVTRHETELLQALHRRQVASLAKPAGGLKSCPEDATWPSADEGA